MSRPCHSAIRTHGGAGKPTLVFVPTRKHAKMAALDLLSHAAGDGSPSQFTSLDAEDLRPYLDKVTDPALRHGLTYGVGFIADSCAGPIT